MAKRGKLTEKEFRVRWKAAPEADRRFLSTLGVIMEAVGGKTLHYLEPSADLERTLDGADRDTLFCLVAECLCRLLKSGVLERVRRVHRQRKRRTACAAAKEGKSGRAGGRRRAK